jgi:dimethylaniline monooxygenase (N-oxide forming)
MIGMTDSVVCGTTTILGHPVRGKAIEFACILMASFLLNIFYWPLSVQTTPQQYEYPGFPFPPEIRNRRDPPAPTSSEVTAYLTNFCQAHDILNRFEFQTSASNITKHPDNTWTMDLQGKGSEMRTERFDFVIICIGIFSTTPNTLKIKGSEEFLQAKGQIIHTSEWTSLDQLKNHRVLVIGNGKSAADVAVAAAQVATHPPIQMIRRQTWYVPRCVFWYSNWATHSRIVSTVLPQHYEDDSWISFFLHFLLYPVKCVAWTLLEVIFLLLLRLPFRVWPKFGTMATEALGVSVLVTDARHLVPIRRGRIDLRIGQVDELYGSHEARLSTGERVPVDLVVLGTGWKSDFSCLDATTVRAKLDWAEDGLWLYRNILAPNQSGIAFVGSNTLTFMHIYTSYVQAYWLVGMMSGRNQLPTVPEMEDAVERDKAFKRRHYPKCPLRGASIEAYMQHYNDLLWLEMGLPAMVHTGWCGWFLNWCGPVLPATMAPNVERWRKTNRAAAWARRSDVVKSGYECR